MSNTFIQEAFRKVYLTEDAEDFSLNVSGPDDTESFLDVINSDEYGEDEMISDVYDLEAEAKEDLKQSYIGKVILDCNVCHSNVFYDKDQITETEDGVCCEELECPYCMSNEGYTIIGEVKPYQKEEDVEIDNIETEEIPEEEPLDEPVEEAELEEGLKSDEVKELRGDEAINGADGPLKAVDELEGSDEIRGPKYKELNEECEDSDKLEECGGTDKLEEAKTPWVVESDADGEIARVKSEAEAKETIDQLKRDDKKLRPNDKVEYSYKLDECGNPELIEDCKLEEDIEDVSINTNDENITMTTKEDGGVVVETSPNVGEVADEPYEGEEMIAPLEPETEVDVEDAIENNNEEDEPQEDEIISDEDFEELPDEDFEEFDEESFDELGESYLKKCYENVTSFKTSSVSLNENNQFVVEGKIGFDSGNEKNTQFVFSQKDNENGRLKLEGYNAQISKGKKTFKLNCSVNDKKLVCESLNYNYKGKNELNESVRVYGTVKRK